MYQVWLLTALDVLTHLILKTPYEVNATIIHILEMSKLRHREVK